MRLGSICRATAPRSANREVLRPALFVVGLVLASGAAACESEPPPAVPVVPVVSVVSVVSVEASASASAPTSPPEAVGDVADPIRDAVVRAHRDAELAFERAAAAADDDPARLSATTAEPMLSRRVAIIQARRTQGWVSAWPPGSVHRDDVVGYELIDDHTAELEVCLVDDAVITDRDTGEVVNSDVGAHRQRHTFERIGSVWKLTARTTLASDEAARCSA